jgi:hypothetical protein
MQAFRTLTGLVAPLDRANVDTDVIIPKQFLKSVNRTGFGLNAFDSWRYLDKGEPGMDHARRPKNPDFALNQPGIRARRPAGAPQFRLWQFTRARALGARRLWLSRADRTFVCRYLFQQLLQERLAADRAVGKRGRAAVRRCRGVSRMQADDRPTHPILIAPPSSPARVRAARAAAPCLSTASTKSA